jgi:murein hydrolase activator
MPPTPLVTGTLAPPAGSGWRWPVDGIVVREFVAKGRAKHEGVLLAAPAESVVVVAHSGQVAYAGNQGTALGNLVIVEHDGEMASVYAHLARTDARVGQRVSAGDALGVVGNTGLVGMTSQLYFEVRKAKVPIDPMALLQQP